MKQSLQQRLLQQAAVVLDLPADDVAGVPRVTLVGEGEVRVDNHRGILAYDTQQMHISGGGYLIVVTGKNLELRAMTGAELLITGEISAITLE